MSRPIKARAPYQVTCPDCKRTFKSAKGLRTHQGLRGNCKGKAEVETLAELITPFGARVSVGYDKDGTPTLVTNPMDELRERALRDPKVRAVRNAIAQREGGAMANESSSGIGFAAGYAWGRSDGGARLRSEEILDFALEWARLKDDFGKGRVTHLPSLMDYFDDYPWSAPVYPQRREERHTKLTPTMREVTASGRPFVLAIDVSGSADCATSQQWLDALSPMPSCQQVITFNNQVRPWTGAALQAPYGGTNFRELQEYVERHYTDDVDIIVLTDDIAISTAPQHPERWTWVSYGNASGPLKWVLPMTTYRIRISDSDTEQV